MSESMTGKLLYEVQLFALTPSLPLVSSRIYQIFKATPTSYNAQYIMRRILSQQGPNRSDLFTRALRYPLCNGDVLDILCQSPSFGGGTRPTGCELPRRLFRNLSPKSDNRPWGDNDYPLPFLRSLYNIPGLPRPNPNSHEGYALIKAVHARHEPLARFLLGHGASPGYKEGLCIMIAIRQRDLTLVKMLIERDDKINGKIGRRHKKRRLEDRVSVSRDMLKLAMKYDARDIAEYLTQEKGVIPDMQALLKI
ncbi:hypothetical protein AX17_006576 [Amanita inopinata Kibby_2008]|nr:hypothetical protein AX17_006576 [Amanita inopinata Kibby_2008]